VASAVVGGEWTASRPGRFTTMDNVQNYFTICIVLIIINKVKAIPVTGRGGL
jgi:hypothetical protein